MADLGMPLQRDGTYGWRTNRVYEARLQTRKHIGYGQRNGGEIK